MKKFLALAVSALMLIAMVPSAMAADAVTKEVYVVEGSAYALPTDIDGAAVVWDVAAVDTSVMAKKVVTGKLADETPVKLIVNVGMYTPTVFDNLNDETVGNSAATTNTAGQWSTYRLMVNGTSYQSEENGNVYLKLHNASQTEDASKYTGESGAFYCFNGKSTEGENLTGKNVVFETKIRVPKSAVSTADNTNGPEILLKRNPANLQAANYTNSYIGARITVENSKYIYRIIKNGGGGDAITIADYDGQWISLRLVIDTTTDDYMVYCNGVYCGTVTDGYFEEAAAGAGFYGVVIRPKGSEVHVDDLLVNTATTGDVLYYGDLAAAPEYILTEDATIANPLISVPLVKSDDSDSGKSTSLVAEPLKDSSMVGVFSTSLMNYETEAVKWSVYRKGSSVEPFDNYTAGTGNAVITEADGNNVLEFGSTTKQSVPTNIASGQEIYELQFDVKLPNAGTTAHNFIVQLLRTNSAAELDMKFVSSTSTGLYELVRGSDFTMIERGKLNPEGFDTVKIVINTTTDEVSAYLNGVLQSTNTYPNDLTGGVASARFYFYEDGEKGYIDNVKINAYESVASVDTTGVATEVSVVKNRVPALTQTVPSTLTDGTFDVLPIKWAAVDTATTGEKNVTGVVQGIADTTVSATVTVIELPYTVNVADGTITINAPTDYKPEGKLYIATYDDNDALTGVAIYDTPITDSTTVSAEGNIRVFLLTDTLEPLAEDAE